MRCIIEGIYEYGVDSHVIMPFSNMFALNRCISSEYTISYNVWMLRSLLDLQLVFRSYRLLIIWKLGFDSLYRVSAVVVAAVVIMLCVVSL